MRRFGKIDANHSEIVKALRQFGCSVKSLASQGDGMPDILVGLRGQNFLLEIKDGNLPPSKQKLTDDERVFHATWNGQVSVVTSVAEALKVINK